MVNIRDENYNNDDNNNNIFANRDFVPVSHKLCSLPSGESGWGRDQYHSYINIYFSLFLQHQMNRRNMGLRQLGLDGKGVFIVSLKRKREKH